MYSLYLFFVKRVLDIIQLQTIIFRMLIDTNKDPLVAKSEEYLLTGTLAQDGITDRIELLLICAEIMEEHGISVTIDDFKNLARKKFDDLIRSGQILVHEVPSIVSTDEIFSIIGKTDIDQLVNRNLINNSWLK